MNQNRLFNSTRWRLAGFYTGVMGAILGLCSIGVYQMVAHAHWQSQDRELEALSGVLHDSLEPILQQPGTIESSVRRVLPNLCILAQNNCQAQMEPSSSRHILSVLQRDSYYYTRFWDLSGRLVATIGSVPDGIPAKLETETWQTLKAGNGDRYHQISILLKTNRNIAWGYMQVGQSLREHEFHTQSLKTILLLGLPIALVLVGGASWWLAGLAMRPIYLSYQQIQQFTADAAHELRTPLSAIRATVDSAKGMDFSIEPEPQSILQSIERQSLRLSQLVQDLLLLARMEQRSIPIKFQPCYLNQIIDDLIEEMSPLAIAAEVELSQEVRGNLPLYALGDEDQLYRLVSNLLINAVQYTQKGGQVKIMLKSDDHCALIQFQDTGIGMTLLDQAQIFDRFYRVHSDRSRSSGGSGLGLAIAKAITLAHQGSIKVQSELNRGSTFTVRLPLTKMNSSISS